MRTNEHQSTSHLASTPNTKRTVSESSSYFNLQKQPEEEVVLQTQEKGSLPTRANLKAISSLVEAAQTVVFTSVSLQHTVSRCLNYIGNDSLHMAFSASLQKAKASTEKVVRTLAVIENDPATPKIVQELPQTVSFCILILKDLCSTLRTRLSILVQGFDAKHSRHLLTSIYSASVDIKSAWETVRPYLTIDPTYTLASLRSMNATPLTTPMKVRSQQEFKTSSAANSPSIVKPDNSQLYAQLKMLVSSSLNVIGLLNQSIGKTLQNNNYQGGAALEGKLNGLIRQTQYATELSQSLSKHLEVMMAMKNEDFLKSPRRKESSRRMWEDTSIYLKAIVSIMTLIRSISTEEDFQWPKPIKQGCLYVTRMSAEVAKLWNRSSTFAEDGYFLGRQSSSNTSSSASTPAAVGGPATPATVLHHHAIDIERKGSSSNTSEQSLSPATATIPKQ
ncbi:hypothetical protein BDF20DRAFT_922716 [Mycotypha africana]|uniref:uncharacterized protein n=1 Tax=Mycotypha africana TaxID=64632 RepID=UPI0023018F65|nr:uncharacterized protein BDF20DRAFT_922716 [Mycotypha africana]KAI8970134.1 hypothetical protein BDF20DRAFT_922716 [Mycotypha africana]